MKRLLKWILISFSSLLLLAGIALAVIPSLYEKNIRLDVEKQINQQVNAEVSFDHLSLRVYRHFPNLTLSLHDLLILGKDEFKIDTLAWIKEAQFEVNLFSLLTKETEIKSIHLVDPVINIYVLQDGRANYNIAKPSDTTQQTSSPINIAIDQFSIQNGEVNYHDWQKNMFVTASGVEHQGEGDFLNEIFDYKTITVIRHFSMNYDKVQYLNRKTVGIDLVMEMNLPETKFTFKENEIRIDHFNFSIEGFFQQVLDKYAMNMRFKANETSFKNILSLIPGLYLKNFDYLETSGDLGFSGSLDGILSDSSEEMPAFHLNVNVKNAMVKIDTLPDSFRNINFDLAIDNPEHVLDSTIFTLKDFHIDFGKHPLHGNVRVQGLHKPKVNADIFADLDLAAVERLFPMKGIVLKGRTNFELKANGVVDIAQSVMPAFSLNLKMTDGFVKYDTLPQPISNIQFHLEALNKTGNLSQTILDFKKVHADFGENPLRGAVKLSGYPEVNIDADVSAMMNIEDIEKIYPVDGYWLKGKFEMDITAKGLYSESKKKFPLVDAKMKLTDGSVQFKAYPHPIKDVQFFAEAISKTGDLKDAQFQLSKLTYSLEDEPFEISGTVSDLDNFKYSLSANGKIDLAKMSKIYPIADLEMAGLIDAQITTSGLLSDLEKGKYAKTASSGKVELSNILFTGKKVINPIRIDRASFAFSPEKLVLSALEGKLGKTKVKAHGDVYDYMNFMRRKKKQLIKIDLDVVCDTLDLNEWMPPVTVAGKPVNQPDTSQMKLTVMEVPRNIDFTFDSKIHYMEFDDLLISEMDGEITMKDGVLSLHEAGFNSLNARFNVTGDYDTRDMAHPVFDFDLKIEELDINKAYNQIKLVRQLAPSAANTYGKLSVDYKLKGEFAKDLQPKMETLVGGGTMRIAEAKINGMKLFEEISKSAKKNEINDPHLKDFEMETEIRDSKIIVKPFSIRVSGFDADIEGFNTMSGMVNYLVKIELIPLTKIKVPFHVTGHYDNPKVALGKGHTIPD